jgi:hypothetical protein
VAITPNLWPPRSEQIGASYADVVARPASPAAPGGHRRVAAWLAVVAVLAGPVFEAIRLGLERPHLTLYGDQALIDLAARRAAHLDQLVGPYSVQGFHHPGPAVFYALAPFSHLFQPGGAGLYLGATVWNGLALVAIVAMVWRREGPLGALAAAVCLDAFSLLLGVGTLREPWNPYLVIVPTILFVVLWAVAVADPAAKAPGVWAFAVGSYVVQTHIATLPFVALLALALIGVWIAAAGRRRPTKESGWAIFGGLAAFGLLWTAPIVELWRDDRNNLSVMWSYVTSSHHTAGMSSGVHSGLDAIGVVPFGNHVYTLVSARSGLEQVVTAVLLIGATAATLGFGVARSKPLVVALSIGAAVEAVVGLVSLSVAPSPLIPYYSEWLSGIMVTLALAIGLCLVGFRSASDLSVRVVAGPAVVVIAVAAMAVAAVASEIPVQRTTGSGPWPAWEVGTVAGKRATVMETAYLSAAAVRAVGGAPRSSLVNIEIGSDAYWPYAAGMALALDEAGIQTTVGPGKWALFFGHERAPGPRVVGSLELLPSSAETVAGARVVARTDHLELVYASGTIPPRSRNPGGALRRS